MAYQASAAASESALIFFCYSFCIKTKRVRKEIWGGVEVKTLHNIQNAKCYN
jgi:hypothetical protein